MLRYLTFSTAVCRCLVSQRDPGTTQSMTLRKSEFCRTQDVSNCVDNQYRMSDGHNARPFNWRAVHDDGHSPEVDTVHCTGRHGSKAFLL